MNKWTVSNKQLFLFLFIIQTGTIFITLQTRVIKAAEQNAWIVFTIVSFLHCVLLIIFNKYYKYFQLNKFEKWLFQIYWYVVVIIFLATIDFLLIVWVFPLTPHFIVIGLIVFISFYVNISKYAVPLNISVILIPFIILFLGALFLAVPDLIWTNLFPIGHIQKDQWIGGAKESLNAFIGLEAFLILRPFVQDKREIKTKQILSYQLALTLFFLITIMFTILFFPLEELKLIPVAITFLLKSQDVTFVERLDLFFTYIWMMWSIITVALFIFLGIHLYKTMHKRHFKFTVIIHLVIFICPLFLLSREILKTANDLLAYGHLFFGILLPLFILFKGWRKSLRE
ncbi:spore gernimation protein [Psychrobacillus glaciei]|uniref:Spore gernimation protein n=1 Tax=Psychrobacillus glaciei TaxID=2283160 RepID=A0A5J6SLN9_9BACI|nr:GerAB/ArcD/ProY family transporter [Psychrobacillus glaciei]QFF98920.1 spore gernimation protein [Psychrobacillus glaciei]